uniref:ATP-dependent RNA helicase n=1 Tax=Arcella intermedia TaxID=1963864 RepID=A0A6B2KYR2_9EUKA
MSSKSEQEKTDAWKFSYLPLSYRTQQGLMSSKFVTMTAIQKASLPHSLAGRDVLGAAKTGSGKTLAFLIPVLELLWRVGWTNLDGLGALVLSPTRELALQTFEVLCQIGKKHNQISAGLVIGGGTHLEREQECIGNMNILIATPGRLLQHMDQTPNFNTSNLQILVLDEADRMLDLGFKKELNAILENLPIQRQTLLFSATQSASVSQLARLSLKEPEFVSVHAQSVWSTPSRMQQYYSVFPLQDKINMLWTFLRKNTNSKILVFFSTQKEVRYINESFRLLRPGIPVMHLHGKMSQMKREKVFFRFQEMESAVLFATDVAARGLDFKKIDWVLQFDCPEDVDTYIHRCGRTARYKDKGSALLFLLPSEIKMVELLKARKIPIEESHPNSADVMDINNPLQELLLQHNEIKYLAQKALRAYLKSVHLMQNKEVFNFDALPYQEFSKSMGLIGVPQIKLVQTAKVDKNELRNQEKLERLFNNAEASEKESIIPVRPKKVQRNKVQKLLDRKNTTVFSEAAMKLIEPEESEDILVKKTENQAHLQDFGELKKRKDRGPTIDTLDLEVDNKINFYEKAKQDIDAVDPSDKREYMQKVRERKLKKKEQEKEEERSLRPNQYSATLAETVDSEEEFVGKEYYSSDEDEEEQEQYNPRPPPNKRQRNF